ncbi:Uma2 family endonuclease [Methylolobus aquaticus]
MTADEFLEWEQTQSEKYEYVDGFVYPVYAMVGARDAHVTVAGNVFAELLAHLRGGPYRVYISDMKLRVDAANVYFYPDVFVTCDARDRSDPLAKRHPSLIVEVLSDSTAAYDRGEKFALYRQIDTLQEYVLVDPFRFTVDCFRRDPSDHWVLYHWVLYHWVLYPFAGSDTLELASVGFKAPLAALFEDVESALPVPNSD